MTLSGGASLKGCHEENINDETELTASSDLFLSFCKTQKYSIKWSTVYLCGLVKLKICGVVLVVKTPGT